MLLNSLDAFNTHVEVRPVVSDAVHLSWRYLIRFQDRKVPEKQVSELSFASAHVMSFIRRDAVVVIGHSLPVHQASANIRIQHTARTWGVDLEALVTGHINSMMRTESKTLKWIHENNGLVSLIAGISFSTASVFVAYTVNSDIIAKQVAEIETTLTSQGNDLTGMSRRLDLIIRNLSTSGWRAMSDVLPTQIVISAVASTVFAAIIGGLADNAPQSYILLSKKAEEKMKSDERKLRRLWWELAVSFILGIVGGVISNMLLRGCEPKTQAGRVKPYSARNCGGRHNMGCS